MIASMHTKKDGLVGHALFGLNSDDEPEMQGFSPKRENTFHLNFGPYDNPHSENWYPTARMRAAAMWAMRLCDHPDLAWYNDPRDPGLISNENWDKSGFYKLDGNLQATINQLVEEDNKICADGSDTIEEAIENLLNECRTALNNNPLLLNTGLKNAIEDVETWIENLNEQNQSYSQRGWLGSDGRP